MKKSRLLLTTACSTFIVLAVPAMAQDYGSVTPIQGISKTANGEGGVDAKAPVKIPLKSPYTVSIISRKTIAAASAGTTAQDILGREPSIYVTDNGPGGVNQNVTYRAFNSAQFSETFDGIAINDAFNGAVTAQADNDNNTLVSGNDFDSIQLYRGINNPAVNSYDSLGGTVNYVPRMPTNDYNAEVGAGYGSFDTFHWHATLNTGLHYGVKQLFSFSRSTSSGWTQLDKNSGSNLYYSVNAPLNGGNTNIYGIFIYNQSAGDVAQLMPIDLLYQNGDSYQLPTSDYYKQNNSTNFAGIVGVTQQITPYLSADVKGFFAENDYDRNSYCNRSFSDTYAYYVNDCSHRSYHLYAYYTNTIGVQPSATLDLPFNTVKFGGNLTSSHLHSREFFSATAPVVPNPQPNGSGNDFWNEHDVRTLGSIYAQDTISLYDDKLTVTPGVKYVFAETKDTDEAAYYYPYTGSASNYAHFISPTIGINYEFMPNFAVYAAFGQNIKFPQITSYYNNIATNSGTVEPVHVQPEHVNDYEVGLRYEKGPLTAEFNYYREDFTNTFLNYTDPATGNSTTINGGKSRYEGEELQLGDDFGAIGGDMVPGDFTGYLNYAHNNANYTSNFSDSLVGNVKNGQPVANVPVDLLSAGADWTYDNYYAAVDVRYIGSRYITNNVTNVSTTSKAGSYVVTNLTLQDTIPVNFGVTKSLVVKFNIDNLFGVRYYNSTDINSGNTVAVYQEGLIGAPRAFYGDVTMKF